MAKASAPYGFQVYEKLKRAKIYAVPTAPTINVMIQDMVASGNTSIITAKMGLRLAILVANIIGSQPGHTTPILGSVLECFDSNMDPISTGYIPAGTVGDGTTAGYVLVADDPGQVYSAQIDSAVTAANLDLNYDIGSPSLSAGNTSTGISKQYIVTSGAASTNTIPIRLLGQADLTEDTTAAYAKMICQINPETHYWGQGTAA